MIKFTAAGAGVTLIGLGLAPENIRRMQAGLAIRVKLSDLGFTGAIGNCQIMLFTGDSHAAMRESLKPFIGPDTVIHDEGGSK